MIKNNILYIAIKNNFVTFSRTPAALILVILPVVMLFIFGTIYPVTNILPHIITVSIITVSFSFVGIQFIEYRQNRFFRTNSSISMPNSVFICGAFITLCIVLTLSTITLINISWLFSTPIPILQQTVDNIYYEELDPIKQFIDGEAFFSSFSISNISFVLLSYSMLVSIVMTSLFAILLASMFKSVKSYTVLTLSYLILYIVLGGLAIPYNVIQKSQALTFLSDMIPNTHTSSLLNASFNKGHIEDAYDYIYYTNAIYDWTNSVITHYNDGKLFGLLSLPEYSDGIKLGVIFGDPAINEIIMGELDLIGSPDIDPEWLDPLKSQIIAQMYPWLNPVIQNLNQILGGFGDINVEADTVSLLKAWYIGSYTEGRTDTFMEAIQASGQLYKSLGDSLYLMIRPNPFSLSTKYGIVTNLIPMIIILISLPNFILIGREE